MVRKVVTAKSLMALLYLISATGTALALPTGGPALGNAEPRDEHDMAERSILPREPGDFLPDLMERSTERRGAEPVRGGLAIDYRREPDNFGNIVKRDDRYGNIVKRDDRYGNIVKRDDRYGNVVKRDDRYGNIVKRDDRYGNIVKRDDRYGNIIKREPDNFGNIIKREPDNFGNIVERDNRFGNIAKKEAEPRVDDCDPEIEARDPGVRENAIARDLSGDIDQREPSPQPDRWGGITKRSPEPQDRYEGVDKREPSAEPGSRSGGLNRR
jgi:hypothetical protein